MAQMQQSAGLGILSGVSMSCVHCMQHRCGTPMKGLLYNILKHLKIQERHPTTRIVRYTPYSKKEELRQQ